jgi:hypothetical protein
MMERGDAELNGSFQIEIVTCDCERVLQLIRLELIAISTVPSMRERQIDRSKVSVNKAVHY